MTKNGKKIRQGINMLVQRPYEIVCGIVVSGSVDIAANTMSVLPGNGETPREGVLLNAVGNADNGMVLIPEDNSHVVIGSIEGPGQWLLLQASELRRATIKIGSVSLKITAHGITAAYENTHLEISDLVRISTNTESLHTILSDLLEAIKLITVTTATGTSSVPVNVAAFTALTARLNNLLLA